MTEEWNDGKYQQKYECIQERSEINTCTYTFTEPGTYKPVCRIYNWLDQSAEAVIWNYEVVEPYSLDKPVVVSTLFREDTYSVSGDSPLYVRAEGGKGSYQYKYSIKSDMNISGWTREGEMITSGWVDSDILELTVPMLVTADMRFPYCKIIVTVRDSEGNLSEPVEVEYSQDYRVG